LGRARNFLEAEQRTVWQIDVVVVENFFGHAIAAPKIATVCDADAQIAQGAFSLIKQLLSRRPSLSL